MLCAIGFEGKGYDGPFTANLAHIVQGQLRGPGGKDIAVFITGEADSICAPCPKRRGTSCEVAPKIAGLDARHGAALDLVPGQALTWGDCLDRVRARVVPADLVQLCAGCGWLDQGMCQRRLADLLDGRPPTA